MLRERLPLLPNQEVTDKDNAFSNTAFPNQKVNLWNTFQDERFPFSFILQEVFFLLVMSVKHQICVAARSLHPKQHRFSLPSCKIETGTVPPGWASSEQCELFQGCWQHPPWDHQSLGKLRAAHHEHPGWQDAAQEDGLKPQGGKQ